MNKLDIVRLVNRSDFLAKENEIRKRKSSVSIYYNINWSYFENYVTILSLVAAIREEFPNIQDGEMSIQHLRLTNAECPMIITVIRVDVSIDKFLQLRNESKLLSM